MALRLPPEFIACGEGNLINTLIATNFFFRMKPEPVSNPHDPMPIAHCLLSLAYSLLNEFTGFATAALMDSKLMVSQAISSAMNPGKTKYIQLTSIR